MQVNTPDLGIDSTDGTKISQIVVKIGDYITKNGCLVIAESDKATIENLSPTSGIVTAILVKQGDDISEGKPLVVMEYKQMTTNIQALKFPDFINDATLISWHVFYEPTPRHIRLFTYCHC